MEGLLQKMENEIQENKPYGEVLTVYSYARVCDIKGTMDEITLHKGMKYWEACMKHYCLTNNFNQDKDKLLKNIETLSSAMEQEMKQTLEREHLLKHIRQVKKGLHKKSHPLMANFQLKFVPNFDTKSGKFCKFAIQKKYNGKLCKSEKSSCRNSTISTEVHR